MMAQNQSKQKTIRNLIIFTMCVPVLPWLGWELDILRNADPHDQQKSLGWLLFLITPLAVSLLLRTFAGDGWNDFNLSPAFKGNSKWYIFALVFHPVVHILLLLLGLGIGVNFIPGFSSTKLALLGQAIVAAIIPNIVKNIFEEFAWRGYLAPKIQLVVQKSLIEYAIIGTVWFVWHLPYYLLLLDPLTIHSYTPLSLTAFLPLTCLSLIAASITYGELRRRTNSVWPVVLIHTGSNVLIGAMVDQKFFNIPTMTGEILFSPRWASLSSIALFAATGLWLYHQRIKSSSVQN